MKFDFIFDKKYKKKYNPNLHLLRKGIGAGINKLGNNGSTKAVTTL